MTRSSDTQQRILESARSLIYASSYADVGVARICEHAGVKKGSFYHFFPSKSDLTIAILESFFNDMKTGLIDRAFTVKRPFAKQIDELVRLVYEFQNDIKQETGHVLGCPFGNLASELATTDEAIRCKIDQIFSSLQSVFEGLLNQACENGEISNIDITATANAMLAYFEGVMLLAKTRNDAETLKQLLPALLNIRINLPSN